MGTRTKVVLVVIAIAANIGVFCWRLNNQPEPLPLAPHKPLPLGEKQAAMVLKWKQASKLPLTSETIASTIDQAQWQDCISLPDGAQALSAISLSESQLTDFKQATRGLIAAYADGSAEALLTYMATRGQQLSPLMVQELKKLLATDGGLSEVRLAAFDNRDVFLTFAEKAKYVPHWSALVEGTPCAVFWGVPAGQSLPENLGSEVAGLFQNQTRFHHLFINSDTESPVPELGAYECYADFRFVIEHDEQFLQETSPYYVRFGYHQKLKKWQPLEMVHVATSSGNSPVLLF